jgi:hypothetical protein
MIMRWLLSSSCDHADSTARVPVILFTGLGFPIALRLRAAALIGVG